MSISKGEIALFIIAAALVVAVLWGFDITA